MTLEERRQAAEDFTQRFVSWAAGYVIATLGLVHLLVSGEHFSQATYLGFCFLAVFAACSVSAAGLVAGRKRWAWLLGDAICAVTLVGFVVSRLFGLPGYTSDVNRWFDFPGWVSMTLELSFLGLSLLVLTGRGRSLVNAEQRRVDREELPPSRQQTPEHFALLEDEMREIRERTAPDLRDLRRHVDPKTLAGRAEEDARRRLNNLPKPLPKLLDLTFRRRRP